MRASSTSICCLPPRPRPPWRRRRSRRRSSAVSSSPAGRPSTTTVSWGPCDSPAVSQRSTVLEIIDRVRHTSRDDPATVWLLASNEPAIRRLTLTEVLGASPDEPDVVSARRECATGSIAAALLGDSTDHVYHKWRGAFWRLTALAELGVPSGEHRALGLLDEVLAWLQALERRGYPPVVVAGLHRAHACWHGNALSAAVELGRARDPMATDLARRLVEWQWPDGGWNCDRRPGARTSSVHESLGPLLGLAGYHRATGHAASSRAAQRAAEFFFERRPFRSRRSGQGNPP